MTRRFRPAIPAWLMITLGILTMLAAALILWPRDRLLPDQEAWTFCEQGYANARTPVDSHRLAKEVRVLDRAS